MHRLTRAAVLLLCLSTLTCAKTGEQNEIETVVVVTVSRVTSDLRILRASATLNGSAAMKVEDFVASPPAQQFGLSLPAGVIGPYSLTVEGATENGCIVSRGRASADISGQVRVDLNIVLDQLVTPDCSAVPAACSNEVKEGLETDVDCGGPLCPRCEVGKACGGDGDCITSSCVSGRCASASTCNNMQKDGTETDVDCGGPVCAKCGEGKLCGSNNDCSGGSCVAGRCGQAPFSVIKIEPSAVPTNMTVPITLSGTGFMSGMSVTIGNAAATGVTVTSPTVMQAVAPARSTPALVDVAVRLMGSGTATLSKAFRYYWGQVGFQTPALSNTAGGNEGVAVSDVDGDGKLDVIATSSAQNAVLVYRGKGDGTFLAGVSYPAGNSPVRVAAGDLNKDNKPDLVVSDLNDGKISVYLNEGDGTFAAPVDYVVGGDCVGLVVADLDGDTKPDVAALHSSGGTEVGVFLGLGNGALQDRVDYPVGSSPYELAATDLDGDGKLDLVATNQNHFFVSVLLNQGGGSFDSAVDYGTSTFQPFGIAAGDFNGDRKNDVAVTSNGGSQLGIFLGKGDGTLLLPVKVTTAGNGVRSVAAADVNQDGRLDAIVLGGNGVALLLGKGDGTFQTPVTIGGIGNGGQGAGFTMALGDLNADSKLDVVGANGAGFGVLLGTAN